MARHSFDAQFYYADALFTLTTIPHARMPPAAALSRRADTFADAPHFSFYYRYHKLLSAHTPLYTPTALMRA